MVGEQYRLRRFVETLLDDGSGDTAPWPIEISLVLNWDEEGLVHAVVFMPLATGSLDVLTTIGQRPNTGAAEFDSGALMR